MSTLNRYSLFQHKFDTSETSVTQVKKFDFDNNTSENIFLHQNISYKVNERLQGEKQFHSKITF